jgi:hypothetical protein
LVARTFNYGGFKNRTLYDPEIAPNSSMTKEEYKKNDSPTINHFYENFILKMNTATGKQIAQENIVIWKVSSAVLCGMGRGEVSKQCSVLVFSLLTLKLYFKKPISVLFYIKP